MATKTQRFRARQQRTARPPLPKRPARARRDTPIDTARPGVSATNRKVGLGGTAERNRSARAGRKGGAKLEGSLSGRPSRKSSRSSKGRALRTENLHRKAVSKAAASRTPAVAKRPTKTKTKTRVARSRSGPRR